MPAVPDVHDSDLLAAWIDRKTPRTRLRGHAAPVYRNLGLRLTAPDKQTV